MPSGSDSLIPLAKGSVLYLGSAVPLETSAGLEALQMPLCDRYMTTDPSQKVSGIDAVLTVFSSGLLMQYPGDDSSSTWFPMQTFNMCAAVKAVSNMGSVRFVSVDSPQATTSREPPIFAVIMRRSRGVKVLECHVFVCKSTDAALAFVQSCTHAFQHREGWMNGVPGSDQFNFGGFGASARIVAADSVGGVGMANLPLTQLQGFMYSPDQPTQMYNILGTEPAGAQRPALAPAPAPAQVVQQPSAAPPVQFIAMNPPGAPVPQMAVPQGYSIPQGYFADWDQNFGMTYMVVPDSPFYPGDEEYNKERKKRRKKKNKKKKKSKKKHQEEEADDDEEEEEELYYVRRSKLDQGKLPPDFVQVQQGADRYTVQQQRQSYPDPWSTEVRYSSEPMRSSGRQEEVTTEIHYVPLPASSQLPSTNPPPPPDQIQRSTTDVYLARQTPGGGGYFYDDQGPPSQIAGDFDPYAYRGQLPVRDYDYRGDYDAARQPTYARGEQGVYDRKLPRTDYQFDERGFDGMIDRLGYFP